MATLDYYSVLGVRQSATAEEIRMAYRGKCKSLHHDVNKSPDATRIMQEVNEAYREVTRLGCVLWERKK